MGKVSFYLFNISGCRAFFWSTVCYIRLFLNFEKLVLTENLNSLPALVGNYISHKNIKE